MLPGSQILLVCLLASCATAGVGVRQAHAAGGSLLEQLPQEWHDDRGNATRLGEFQGRRVVFTMAYASCRRICPATIAHLKRLQSELDARGESAEFVIVGYDAAIDDPQTWHEYRESRGLTRDNWHFLIGTPESTAQFARRLGFGFWKYDRHVMHDYRIVVIGAGGTLEAEYGPNS